MNTRIFSVLALSVIVSPLAAQQQSFANTFDRTVQEDGTMGGAYLLLDKGRITEMHAIGIADKEAHQPVDPNMAI